MDDREDHRRRIRSSLPAARAAWPGVVLEDESFVEGVIGRLTSDQQLGDLHLEDLYLTVACANGDPAAIAAFEAKFAPAIAAAAGDASPSLRDEFAQLLRDKLFVAESAKIREYSGRGSLAGWVKITAKRTYLDLVRGIDRKREVPIDDHGMMDEADDADPELAFLKSHYRQEFRESFADAMQTLSSRERNLLRQHLVHRLSVDELGSLYEVHRATAARWVAKAKQAVLETTRGRMRARLRVEPEELESIMRMIESRLEVSLTRHLRVSRASEDA